MNNLQKIAPENLRAIGLSKFYSVISPILLFAALTIHSQPARLSSGADHPSRHLNLLMPLEKCWAYPGVIQPDLHIASDNVGGLYAPLLEGKLVSLDSYSGKLRWETEFGGVLMATPLSDTTNIYTASGYIERERGVNESTDRLIIRSVDKGSGIPIWETELQSVSKIYSLIFRDSILILGDSGFVYSISKIDGHIFWSRNLSSELTAIPFLDDDRLLLGLERRIIILSPNTGLIIEELPSVNRPTAILDGGNNRAGKNVLWGDKKGNLVSFNIRLKKVIWRFRSGAEISYLVSTSRGLLLISRDNFLYLVSEESGGLIWKKRLGDRISSQPLILDKYAILTTVADSSALIVDLKNGNSVNGITLSADTFLTGDVKKSGVFLVFAGSKEIFAFSNRSICSDHKKSN